MEVEGGGSLVICDLAGSERNAKTKSKGERLEEAKHINSSLSALGNCIQSLSLNSRKGTSHDPRLLPLRFRESKLTRVLQSSFTSPDSAILLLICVNVEDYYETMSALAFGVKCRGITSIVSAPKNKKISADLTPFKSTEKNKDIRSDLLQRENDMLKKELNDMKLKFDIMSKQKQQSCSFENQDNASSKRNLSNSQSDSTTTTD